MEDDQLLMLGKVDGKLDSVLVRLEDISNTQKSQSKRIGSLERARSWAGGAIAIISACGAYYIKEFRELMFHANN